jgi:hypothetical protein
MTAAFYILMLLRIPFRNVTTDCFLTTRKNHFLLTLPYLRLIGIVTSANSGTMWNEVLINGKKVQPHTVSVMSNGDIFLGTLATKASGKSILFKSTDGGKTWADADNRITPTGDDAGRAQKKSSSTMQEIFTFQFFKTVRTHLYLKRWWPKLVGNFAHRIWRGICNMVRCRQTNRRDCCSRL